MNRKGFTLLEVLVSISILAISLTAIVNSQSASLRLYDSAKNISTAINLARTKMAYFEMIYKGEQFGEIPEEQDGDFEAEGFPAFKWKMTFKEDELIQQIGDIFGGKKEGENAMMRQAATMSGINPQMIADALGENIRRLELELTWDDGYDSGGLNLFEHFISMNLKGISGLPQRTAAPRKEEEE